MNKQNKYKEKSSLNSSNSNILWDIPNKKNLNSLEFDVGIKNKQE